MKRFSDIKRLRRFNEAEEQEELKKLSVDELSKLAEKERLIKVLTGKEENGEKTLTDQLVGKGEETEKKDGPAVEVAGPSKHFSKLFESREMAHIYHLQVNGEMGSHAKHTALGDYYEGILEFIDDLIEIYQGQYDIIEGYDVIDTKDTNSKDTVEYFKELADFIKVERKCIKDEDTHLHNIIDEVIALVYKTLYKLRFNK